MERDVYPRPTYRFHHAGSLTAAEGVALDGAPNVLVVLLGDVGYGVMSTFGGLVASPTLDRLAKSGLRYCRFHTSGRSAPTRAVTLTGRYHRSVIPRNCATVAELLRHNGYATGWWGKCHHVPEQHTSQAGPFDRWPTGLGFDHYYGYLGALSDQFQPSLYRNTTPVDRPSAGDSAYHLTTDLTNDCIAWMRQQKAIAPERPLFVYFAPPAGRAPQQPPLARRGRHADKFDFGWDEYRKRVYERQLELGVIPRDTRLTQRPSEIRAWSAADERERRLFARFFENYADCVEHTDAEVGRIIDALDELSALENTLVICVVGDRGGSTGDLRSSGGTLNIGAARDGFAESFEDQFNRIGEIGAASSYPQMPDAWSWAGSAPFLWPGTNTPHLGVTRAPLVIHWPRRIPAAGGVRFQFHHVADIAPTILEVVGIAQPSIVNGVTQRPLDGVSMAYSFAAERANVESVRRTQHFNVASGRAQYSDGWLACSPRSDVWELYNVARDFSQSSDVSATEPQKLRELQDLFIAEMAKYEDEDVAPAGRSRTRMTLVPGMSRLPEAACPRTHNVSHAVHASLRVPRSGAEGVIACCGGDAAGWSLYVMNRRLVYHYNFFNIERTEAISNRELPVGEIEVLVEFGNVSAAVLGGSASVALFIDGEPVGSATIPRQVRTGFGTEGIDIGVDKCSPVSRAYRERNGFPFTGTIHRVTIELEGLRHPEPYVAGAPQGKLRAGPSSRSLP